MLSNCVAASFFTSCLQAVCGADQGMGHRKYSTTIGDNSSQMTTQNYHEDDECRIVMERFEKKQGNRTRRFIKATVTLFDDDVDEKHDLFYMVKQPDNPTVSNTRANGVPPLQNRQLLDQ